MRRSSLLVEWVLWTVGYLTVRGLVLVAISQRCAAVLLHTDTVYIYEPSSTSNPTQGVRLITLFVFIFIYLFLFYKFIFIFILLFARSERNLTNESERVRHVR